MWLQLLFGVSIMNLGLEQQIKKLRGNIIFERVYNKHKQRRHRNPEKYTLQQTRLNAIREYLQILKDYEDSKPQIKEPSEKDFWVMVGGVSMRNSKYKELIAEQARCGNVQEFPSRNPESYGYAILKSLFKDEGEEQSENAVDIWEE